MITRPRAPRLLAGLLLVHLLAPGALTQRDGAYERSGQAWVRVENGERFPVDPRVVSVRFAAGSGELSALLAELGRSDPLLAGLEPVRSNRLAVHDLRIPAGADPLAVVAALRQSGRVDFAAENVQGRYATFPNDTLFPNQWNLHNTGQAGGTPGADVDGPEAWNTSDGSSYIVVAVIDSGTDWSHPDLFANIWSNGDEVVDGVDNDKNGYIDDVRGWDFDDGDNNPMGPFFHGTAVAGVVAAVGGNNQGVVGLAGGAADGIGCKVMPLNVGDFFPDGAVLDDAILYAADNGARVITLSMSLGPSPAIDAAIAYAHDVRGVFIDCASGNNGVGVTYPAVLPDVVAVAATNRFDTKASFSNAGPQVELAAPGEDILTTDLFGAYLTQSGTSFAAAHVGAAAALVMSVDRSLTNEQVRQILLETADDVDAPGFDNGTGHGRLNAAAALAALEKVVPGEVEAYGAGVAGFAGQVPEIYTPGPPIQGLTEFAVLLRKARPSAQAYGLVGIAPANLPFEGGALLVDILRTTHLVLPTFTDAAGRAKMPLPMPDDPVVVGLELFTQWVVVDPAGPQGYAFSGGLALTIGS